MKSFLEKLDYIEEQDIIIFSDDSVEDLVVAVFYDSLGDVTACKCFVLEENDREVVMV